MIRNRRFMMLAVLGLILCLLVSTGLTSCGSKEAAPEEAPAAEETQPEAAEPETTEPEAEAPAEDSGADQQTMIGENEALDIAIKDAGVNTGDVTLSIVELDTDDDTGKQEYEVQFNVGATEYEYNIDPYTGKILEKDIDND